MCGRIVQWSDPMGYIIPILGDRDLVFTDPMPPCFNIWPGSRPLTLHRLSGSEVLDRQHWAYRPRGTMRKLACAPLSRVLANSRPWKALAQSGRILVPADGWYEWSPISVGSRPSKQPFYIYSDKPIFLAGLSAWRPGAEKDEEHGFAIVTNDALGGLIDRGGRRPIVLPADLAIDWLNSDISASNALELLREGLPETAFKWHAVRREVGHWRYRLADAIVPI
jgi:putative SOS response-associated peptidase YedK